MFKKAAKHIIPLLLAIMVFITSVGIEINMHYCKDTLSNFSFYSKANVCNQMDELESSKGCENAPEISERDCCSSGTFFYQNDVLTQPSLIFENLAQDFAAVPASSICTTQLTIEGFQNRQSKSINSPPFPNKDYQSYFQVFRI